MICALGVGQPVQSLADVVRADARSAGIKRPEGVVRSLQVILNKIEPSESVFARHLFANDCPRVERADEVVGRGPQVPLIVKPISFACL